MPTIYMKKGIDRYNTPIIKPPPQFLGKNTPPVFGNLKLNPNHFLSNGMVSAWIPGLFNGRDLVGNKNVGLGTGATFGGTYTTGADGQLLQMSSTSNKALECNNVPPNDPVVQALTQGGSLYFRGMMAAAPASYAGYICVYDNGTALIICELKAAPSGTAGFYFVCQTSTNTSVVTWTPVFGNTLSLGASYGQAGGTATAYLNGASSGSISYGSPVVPTGPVTFSLMESEALGADNEGCYCAYIWTRKLSAWEHSYVHANPYSMWMPA